jgi:hypothetical protein
MQRVGLWALFAVVAATLLWGARSLLRQPELVEASGMTLAYAPGLRYWAHNDSGHSSILFGLDQHMRVQRRIRLPVSLRDPEDMTRFEQAGQQYLLIADVGDNRARRPYVTLVWFREPQADVVPKVQILEFRYPDGPRDVEAVSVDPQSGQLVLLSKRDAQPHLYRLDFLQGQTMADSLGRLSSLPPPSAEDLAADPRHGAYSSQPTGMSIHPTGRALVISTYARPYVYWRAPQQTWSQALEGPAHTIPMRRLEQTEAVTWDHTDAIILLSEGHPVPWARVALEPRMSTPPGLQSTP